MVDDIKKTSQDDIANAVIKYLNEPETDYAIMINGPWGSGKTYFIKHKIKDIIKYWGSKFAYVSLYGVSQSTEIDKKILISLYPLLDKNATKIIKGLASAFLRHDNLEVVIKDYSISLKDCVLVFDDLERISGDNYGEILGCINGYIEHRNAKTIILCDESKILDKKYTEIREKTVRYTYQYSLTDEEFFQAVCKIAKTIDESLVSAVERNKEFLIYLSSKKRQNIRTFSQALNNLHYILAGLRTRKHIDKYGDVILRCLTGYLFFRNSGDDGKKIIDTFAANKITKIEAMAIKYFQNQNKETVQEDGSDPATDFAIKFYETYFYDNLPQYISDVALEVCKNGYCANQSIVAEYEKYVAETHPDKSIRQILIQDVWALSTEEIHEAIDDSIQDLRSHKFVSAHTILREMRAIQYCINKKLYAGISIEELIQLGKENIIKIANDNPESLANEVADPSMPAAFIDGFIHQFNSGDTAAKEISEFAITIANRERIKICKNEINRLWNEFSVNHNQQAYFDLLRPDSKYSIEPFFSQVTPDNIKNSVYQIKPKDCFALRDALNHRYERLGNLHNIAEDFYVLDLLHKEIDIVLSKSSGSTVKTPREVALAELNEWLKQNLSKLEAELDR